MKKLITAVLAAFLTMAVAGAYAAEDAKDKDKKGEMKKGEMKKGDGMEKDDMKKKSKDKDEMKK